MRPLFSLLIGSILTCAVCAEPAPSLSKPGKTPTTLPTAFDPARHIRVSEVRPGMKGYGLTVLSGTKITRFDVEVISVLQNAFGPDQSVVMVRCNDEFMNHTGPIQGCSGSPIYLIDESGKPRLLGAYAYGFEWVRDPIIGVQPIEYMLGLQQTATHEEKTARAETWSLLKSDLFMALANKSTMKGAIGSSSAEAVPQSEGGHLKRLMIPLSVRGMSQSQLESLKPLMRECGLEPMLALGGGAPNDDSAAKIEPGSLLGASLLSGDLNMAAIGTCTEVIDGRAYGFGHPFMGEGAVSIPMGPGSVSLVMPVLSASFKLGTVDKITGSIDTDGAFGIAGNLSGKAKTFPIDVTIRDESNSTTKSFHYDCAVHPAMSPMLTGAALQASLTSQKELPRDHTVDYRVKMKFDKGPTLNLSGVVSSVIGDNVPQNAMWPAMLLANNPFGRVHLENVQMEATIRPNTDAAELISARANAPSYKPGETVSIRVWLKPYQGDEYEKSLNYTLPSDLKDGDYSLTICDSGNNLQFETQSQPNQFVVRDLDELFATVETVVGQMRSDRLYVRFAGARQNLAIGRTALTRLPESRRSLLEAAARPNTSGAIETQVTSIDMGRVVSGSVDLVIHVAKKLP